MLSSRVTTTELSRRAAGLHSAQVHNNTKAHSAVSARPDRLSVRRTQKLLVPAAVLVQNCGTILQEHVVSDTSEWRTFSEKVRLQNVLRTRSHPLRASVAHTSLA